MGSSIRPTPLILQPYCSELAPARLGEESGGCCGVIGPVPSTTLDKKHRYGVIVGQGYLILHRRVNSKNVGFPVVIQDVCWLPGAAGRFFCEFYREGLTG